MVIKEHPQSVNALLSPHNAQMPFSVKATYYRTGELRKISFSSFPSYEELYNQVCTPTSAA
jgi:hypothetical protein